MLLTKIFVVRYTGNGDKWMIFFIFIFVSFLKCVQQFLIPLKYLIDANFCYTVKNHMCANMTPTFGAVVTPKWCQCNTTGATVTP